MSMQDCSVNWVLLRKYFVVLFIWWKDAQKQNTWHPPSLRWQRFIIPNVCEVKRIKESCNTTLKKEKRNGKKRRNKKKNDVTQFSGLIVRTTSTRREGKENRYREKFWNGNVSFFYQSNMRIQNSIMEQDHLRMNVAPVINNHLRYIEPLVSVIYH